MKVPHDADPNALAPLVPGVPQLFAQLHLHRHLLDNHHHMFHASIT